MGKFSAILLFLLLAGAEVRAVNEAACKKAIAENSPPPMPTAIVNRLRLPSAPRTRKLLNLLFEQGVVPVLKEGERLGMPTTQWEIRESAGLIDLWSGPKGNPFGHYQLKLVGERDLVYPKQGLPQLYFDGKIIRGELRLSSDSSDWNILQIIGWVRSLFRADPFLHPQRFHPDWDSNTASLVTWPQRDSRLGLRELETSENPLGRSRRGVVMAPNGGKTNVAARLPGDLADELKNRAPIWKKPANVLVCLQNTPGLSGHADTFVREMKINEKNIQRVFKEHLPDPDDFTIEDTARLLLISRSSMARKWERIENWVLENPDKPFVVVLDEAQHTGKNPGEFKRILDSLERLLSDDSIAARLRVVLLSATLSHKDRNIITDFLHGNVVAVGLSDSQLAALKAGKDIPQLSRALFYKQTEAGYSGTISEIFLIPEIDGVPTRELLIDVGYNAADGTYRAQGLANRVAELTQSSRKAFVRDRGIFFAATTDEADAYAKMLSEGLKAPVKAYHSRVKKSSDVMKWFSESADEDRYLVVVDMLTEAVNLKINLLGFLRNYGENTGGFTEFFQQVGRAARLWDYQTDFRIIDPALGSRFLVDGLSHLMIERDPQHQEMKPSVGRVSVVRGKEIKSFSPEQFDDAILELFPPTGTPGPGSFMAKHPFYDHHVFTTQTVPLLWEFSKTLSLAVTKGEYKTQEFALQLAAALEEDDRSAELIARLSDRKLWDWKATDGMMVFQTNQFEACARFYEALYGVAWLVKMTPEGKGLDLERLHEPQNMQELLTVLYPNRQSLLDPDQVRVFLNPKLGALSLIPEELSFQGHVATRGAEKYAALFVAAAKRLAVTPKRNLLIKDFEENWNWANDDASLWYAQDGELPPAPWNLSDRLRMSRRPFQRPYRALYALAGEAKEQGYPIDPDRIYLREEALKLISYLFPEVLRYEISEAEVELFRDLEKGANPLIVERQKIFEIEDWRYKFGPRQAALKLLDLIDTRGNKAWEEKKKRYHQMVKDADFWKANDGYNMARGARPPIFFLRVLHLVADFYLETSGDPNFSPSKIAERSTMSYLIDTLRMKQALPAILDKRTWEELKDKEKGALALIEIEAKKNGYSSFQREFAAYETLNLMLRSPRIAPLVDAETNRTFQVLWGWVTDDGNAAQDSLAAATRIYRALVLIANYARKLPGGETIRIDRIHTREEFQKLLLVLYPERVGKLGEDEIISRFCHPDTGGLRAIVKRLSLLGVVRFVDSFGARESILNLLFSLDVGNNRELFREKEALRNKLFAYDWSAVDGRMLKQGKPLAAKRYLNALTEVISFHNKVNPTASIDIDNVWDEKGMAAAVDIMILGVAIPDLTPEQVKTFLDADDGAHWTMKQAYAASDRLYYNSDFGPKRLLLEVIPLPDARRKFNQRALKFLNDDGLWGWVPTDGVSAQSAGGEMAIFRNYRALYLRAYIAVQDGKSDVDLSEIYTENGFSQFFVDVAK